MERQRNTQQVKEHDKWPPNPTNEENIRNLSEKEFRIMIIKMIQNLENIQDFAKVLLGNLEANKPASKDTMLKGPAQKDSDSVKLGWSNIWDLIVFKTLLWGGTISSAERVEDN